MRTQIQQSLSSSDALRSPDLHDLADFPRLPLPNSRFLVVVLAVAAVLTLGQFVLNGTFDAAQQHAPRPTLARV